MSPEVIDINMLSVYNVEVKILTMEDLNGKIFEQKVGDNRSKEYHGDTDLWRTDTQIFSAIDTAQNSREKFDKLMAGKYDKKIVAQISPAIQEKIRNGNKGGEMIENFQLSTLLENEGNLGVFEHYKVDMHRFYFDNRTSVILLTVDRQRGKGVITNLESANSQMALDMPELSQYNLVPFDRKTSHINRFEHTTERAYFVSKPVPTAMVPQVADILKAKFERSQSGKRTLRLDNRDTVQTTQ
jgi:hypothetical protein